METHGDDLGLPRGVQVLRAAVHVVGNAVGGVHVRSGDRVGAGGLVRDVEVAEGTDVGGLVGARRTGEVILEDLDGLGRQARLHLLEAVHQVGAAFQGREGFGTPGGGQGIVIEAVVELIEQGLLPVELPGLDGGVEPFQKARSLVGSGLGAHGDQGHQGE